MLFQSTMQQGMSTSIVVLLILLFILLFALIIASFVFWILMIIDCVQRKRLSEGERVAWILVLVILGIVGALIYYFAVKRK